MSTRKDIIESCRASIKTRYERPSLHDLDPVEYADVLLKFIARAESVGCNVVSADSEDEIDHIIETVYPDAKVIASNLKAVRNATENPDEVADAQTLDHTDVGVVRAFLGVAENGSVWIPQTMKERDVCFISENLVAVMPEGAVVSNMHEAYKKITEKEYGYEDFCESGYGVFIAGPSKTADIAQVLVKGAQAARGMTLVLIKDKKQNNT